MTTAEILESLTDRARFELLATSVLRKAEPKYAGVIQTGINAQGETIVAPVDGLHLIPHSSPPHYIFVQHTTTDRERLRGKWLSNEDADLPKAIAEAKKIRQKQADAIFTVVLTTNQRVDSRLVTDVCQYAHTERVAVDIWEQTRLSHALEITSDGQWLRKLYLGVDAERLSADLLHQLGRRSLELYRQEVLLPGHGLTVRRSQIDSILANGVPDGPGLCLVVGRSGYGKSVAAVEALDQWLSNGCFGLWLPARFLQDAACLESALDAYLRSLHPSLEPDAGRVAIDLAGRAGRLLLCVDDINRTAETARLLRLAVSLAMPLSGAPERSNQDGGTTVAANPVCQVVPIWPEQLASLPSKLLEGPCVRTVTVSELLPDECSEMIRTKVLRLSAVGAREYAARLNHDPFLVGLFTVMADGHMDDVQLRAVADDAIGRFLDMQFKELCSTPAVNLLPAEMIDVLGSVAREMILRRNLRPSWKELEDWFGDQSKTIRGLRLLVGHGNVCRLDAERRLEYRHDRLHERFLVQAMCDLLSLSDSFEHIVTDPYYSAVVGKALTRTELSPDRLARLRAQAPWVIFEALRQVGEPANAHHERLVEAARTWAVNDSQFVPDSVLNEICRTLMETDSSRVFAIIDLMKPNRFLMAAGLRNGSAEHGMRFIRGSVRHGFEPGVTHDRRDQIVAHGGRRHGEQLARQLRDRLSDTELSAVDANAYLALLGHLGFSGFDDLIKDVWTRHGDEVLGYAIWAACRCPLQNTEHVLGSLIGRLAAMPVRNDDTSSLAERESLTQQLGWGFRKGITHESLMILVRAAENDLTLHQDVARMLDGVDNADGVEFLVRHSGWSQWTRIGDGEPQNRLSIPGTNERLLSLWQSPDEESSVRVNAFCLWLQTTNCKNTAVLRSIEPDSPFYRYAIQHRIKLGDPSVALDLLKLLRSEDIHGFWWVMVHRVWCDEIRSFTSEVLRSLDGTIPTDFSGGRFDKLHYLANVLVKIPVADAEELLQSNWGHLKHSPLMVQAAFRIGTPACTRLASEALSLCPESVDIFHLAFSTIWNRKNPANPITLRHLENLEPFLHRLTEHELLFLAWDTERAVGLDEEIAEWIRKNVVPRLPREDQIRVNVADEMLVDYLDRGFQEKEFVPYLDLLFEKRGGQRLVFPERQLRLVGEWLSNHRTLRGLQVAAECLRYIGSRRDLELLDRYPIDGVIVEIERIKADARFEVCKRTLV